MENPAVSARENEVKAFFWSLLEFAAERAKDNLQAFPVIWDEPDSPIIRYVVDTAQANHFPNLPEEQKVYFECSLSRFRFVLDRVTKYLPLESSILDVGCALDYLSIFLDALGYRVHGCDLNEN